MDRQKTVCAIHDLSGLGKCSLTCAIPILSSAGVSVGTLPTAVLSTQTGGLNEYTYRDLTEDMRLIIRHWKKIGIKFDSVYSGFLGSAEQIDIVSSFVDDFKRSGDSLFLCDPAMADNGKLYDTFDASFVAEMLSLCKKADIIIPNVTEACMLLGREYAALPMNREAAADILKSLQSLTGAKYVVLTGVSFDDESIGSASLDAFSGRVAFEFSKKITGMFHSTGDVFASAFLGAALNGFGVEDACSAASEFTLSAIEKTVENGGDSRFGLRFEECLSDYMKRLGLI